MKPQKRPCQKWQPYNRERYVIQVRAILSGKARIFCFSRSDMLNNGIKYVAFHSSYSENIVLEGQPFTSIEVNPAFRAKIAQS